MLSSLFSVVIPCYNQAEFLATAINSVLEQRYQNWECILVNDGSTDQTSEVIKEYAARDPRIRFLEKVNGGLASARNAGIKMAKGEYILPLDADDRIGREYLLLAATALEKNSEIKVLYCEAELFGEASGKWELPAFSLNLLAQTNMIFCSAIYRKKDWEAANGYDPEMKFGFEDWEFWINLLKSGEGVVHKLDYVGFFYRIKNNSMFGSMNEQQMLFAENYISTKHADFIHRMLGNPIYLSRKLNYYKGRTEKIENSMLYRLYKKLNP
jgi:glycosyltransferase involved in cell wall biosynthesis